MAVNETDESKISYPVNIYVFSGDACIETAKIESEDTPISLRLPEGSYDVYAIAGADAETYNLPTKENAAKEYLIKLNDGKRTQILWQQKQCHFGIWRRKYTNVVA